MKNTQLEEWIPVTFKISDRDYNRLLEACELSRMSRSEVCRLILVNNLHNFINEFDHNGVRAEINAALTAKTNLQNFFGEIVYIVYQRDTGIPESLILIEKMLEEGKLNKALIEEIKRYTDIKMNIIEKYLPEDAKMFSDFLTRFTKRSMLYERSEGDE